MTDKKEDDFTKILNREDLISLLQTLIETEMDKEKIKSVVKILGGTELLKEKSLSKYREKELKTQLERFIDQGTQSLFPSHIIELIADKVTGGLDYRENKSHIRYVYNEMSKLDVYTILKSLTERETRVIFFP